MEISKELQDKATAATIKLRLGSVFLWHIFKKHKLVWAPVKTACTDGRTIWVDPRFADKLTPGELAFLFAHESWHTARAHHIRNKPFEDKQDYNKAADFSINGLMDKDNELKKFGVTMTGLLEGGCLDHDYTHLSPEVIYEKIHDPNKPKEICAVGVCQKGDGDGDGDGDDGPGEFEDWGAVISPKNASPSEVKKELERVKEVVNQAHVASTIAGKTSSQGEELVKELNVAKIPYKQLLAEFVVDVINEDHDWSTPRYSTIGLGVYLPVDRGESIGNFVFAVDCSGSVSEEEVVQAVSELHDVLKIYETSGRDGVTMDVLYFDTKVYHKETLQLGDSPKPKVSRGGTCYIDVMAQAKTKAADHDAEALIVMTDGYCSTFGKDPGIPVLWVLSGQSINNHFEPPFGRIAWSENNMEDNVL